ncbi:MAG: ATP-binding protein [Candidatus Margulisiibacteriota bacterium]
MKSINKHKNNQKLLFHDLRDKIFWGIRIRYAVILLAALIIVFALINRITLGLSPFLIGWLLLYNGLIHLFYRPSREFRLWQLVLLRSLTQVFDIFTITFLVYISGGLESPYWFLYLVLIVVSGFGVYSSSSQSVFLIAMFSALFYLGMLGLTYLGFLPTYGPTFTLSPQELLRSILNRAVFTTISFFLFAGTIYYFSRLLSQHRAELIRKNEELLAALEELKEIDRLKDEFVATVSHELRTPLSVVSENISLIEDGVVGGVDQRQKELLAVSRFNIDRLAGILDQLLDISRIESRSLELKRVRVDLVELVNRAVELLRGRAAEKKIMIEKKLPPKLEEWVDPDQFLRVIINLVDNAIKYSGSGSRIEIGLKLLPDTVRGYVADHGIGILPADQEKIFERFVRLENSHTIVVKGTGLGLSICRGIIELHNGKLWVESKLGQGSKFIFSLPRIEK